MGEVFDLLACISDRIILQSTSSSIDLDMDTPCFISKSERERGDDSSKR